MQLLSDMPQPVLGLYRKDLDIGEASQEDIENILMNLFDRFRPDCIINAAAYTAVDQAEVDAQRAARVNAWFPGLLGRIAHHLPILHFSTDYVFDGTKTEAYKEDDMPSPLGVYGLTKLQGEQALLQASARATVIRCSWVVGPDGQNFAKTILRLACEREELRVVDDQFGVPTPTDFLVREITRHPITSFPPGLYHLVPSGRINWYEYAVWLIEKAQDHPLWRHRLRVRANNVRGIASDQYPTRVQRPKNSSLDTSKWRFASGQSNLPPWHEALAPTVAKILDSGPGR